MRYFSRPTSIETPYKSLLAAADVSDAAISEIVASSAELAPMNDQLLEFVLASCKGEYAFATDMTPQEGGSCSIMMSHLLKTFGIGITFHIMPNIEMAEAFSTHIFESLGRVETAAAVSEVTTQEQFEELYLQLENSAQITCISTTPAGFADFRIGSKLMEYLIKHDKLARFVLHDAQTLITSEDQHILRWQDIVKKHSYIPVMSWSASLFNWNLDKVLAGVGIIIPTHFTTTVSTAVDTSELQPIKYVNYGDDAYLHNRDKHQNCDKFHAEQDLGETRDMSNWAIKLVEMIESNHHRPMPVTLLADSLIGRKGVKQETFKRYGHLRHWGYAAGLEPFTLEKICKELTWLGAFQQNDKVNHFEVNVMSDSIAVALVKSGQMLLHLPVKHIYIYVYGGNRVKGEFINEIGVANHEVMFCSCNPNRQTREEQAVL